ncbi:MAG: NAD(P)-dependent oxidoreductase [Deltaproteobacteria bacterium]|nr:NAD(P)-dependent oxidoreductase [Deltaproteobacteria bacterium]
MQVVSIIGASSFIGTHLLERLSLCSDLHLRLLVNRNPNLILQESDKVSIIRGNLLDTKTLNGLVKTGCIVINLAYLSGRRPEENFAAINNLVEVCSRAKIRRLIHCSTAVVSGRVSADRVTENTPNKPVKEYEVTKQRIEKIILEKSNGLFETIILRPTAVFGKGGSNLIKLADDLLCENRLVNYIKSCIYQFRRINLVYIDNVVAAIEFFIKTDRTIIGETFIISDDEDPSNNYRYIEKYLMKRMGCKPYPVPPVSVPFLILKSLLWLSGRTNDNPALVYDCGKILSSGFKKPVSFEEGLSHFSDWYIKTHLQS